jgi:hypothetical protein
MKTILLVLLAVLFAAPAAQAYPEMVRHGYVNCTSCHVSPSGGGILTQYGRQLSRDVLSTWGKEGEEGFAYSIMKSPEWLNLGGDFREAYLYVNSPSTSQGRSIFMQADLEAAVSIGKEWTVDATAGYKDPDARGTVLNSTTADHFLSRRHYVNYRPLETLSFRVGKFSYNYGINMADHTTIVRGGLAGARTGLGINDEGYETYNFEAAWIGENFSTFVTAIAGRPDAKDLGREKGANLNSSMAIGETSKVGVSYLYAKKDTGNRSVFGPYGIIGFTKNFFLLTEIDFQSNHPTMVGVSPETQWGFGDYFRLDYEWHQGCHVFLTHEQGRFDFRSDQTGLHEYGLGAQFFPRPHFELEMTWQKQSFASLESSIDVAFLMGHFYF